MPTFELASDDDALVRRVRAGDPTAFAAIHARYRRPLLGFAGRRLGCRRDEAEDVVQDTFIRAYRALVADDRPVALRPWLYSIVRNRVTDELRRAPRGPALEAAEDRSAGPFATAAEREELRAVVADVTALPARQREALVRLAVDGEPHERVAARLGTTVAGSKNLVNRARLSLSASRCSRRGCQGLGEL